ncbi:MAG: ABC transporter substrate-binding protein [Deltaproteobacteria bacterium]|nr:ABC transporter substrate-binding protein [Deltaproteobacteria bacterium]
MKRKEIVGKGAVCLIAAVLLVTLTLIPVVKVHAAEPYKVGAVFSVTGPLSFLGDPEKKTAMMLAEQINAAGGINGHPLELVVYDDEGKADKCQLLVRKLITQDKVCAIIGPSLSGNSMAVVAEAKKHEIPLVSCAASHKIVTKDGETGEQRKWVFKTPQSDSMAVEAIYTHMKKHGISKIAIMAASDGFGQSGRGELLRLAPKYGLTIVADEKYDRKDTDMTTQLTKIKGLAPQAIVNWSVGTAQVVMVKNRKDLGMTNITLYQSHGFGSLKNIEQSGDAAEGVYCPLGAVNVAEILPNDHLQKRVTMGYLRAYSAKYNEPLSSFGGHAWDALTMMEKALAAVGCDKAKIRDYLENLTGFVGQHGVFNFSPKDHNGLTREAFQMVVVKNANWALAD